MNTQFIKDSFHYFGIEKVSVAQLFRDYGYRYVFYLRMCQSGGWRKALFTFPRKHLSRKCGLEISPDTPIGSGFYIGHPYGITVNKTAVIGQNVNIHKGCTIGQENRGPRKGSPSIGNQVYLGVNSTVVGDITVGNDVFIAANAFVNRDIPDHSIVIGSPCKIIPSKGATDNYVINLI